MCRCATTAARGMARRRRKPPNAPPGARRRARLWLVARIGPANYPEVRPGTYVFNDLSSVPVTADGRQAERWMVSARGRVK
jgi:D-serine deaminase-like pyridoxal phosphate-dependent protein